MSGPNMIVVDGQLHRLVTPNISALVRFLKREFQIPEGCDFAGLLAPEGPACNDACLRQWVQGQMVDLANHPLDERENLMVTLEERLLKAVIDRLPYEYLINLDIPSLFARKSRFPFPFWAPIPASLADESDPEPEAVTASQSINTTERSPQ
jgi:hypothetical protein